MMQAGDTGHIPPLIFYFFLTREMTCITWNVFLLTENPETGVDEKKRRPGACPAPQLKNFFDEEKQIHQKVYQQKTTHKGPSASDRNWRIK